jgi:predicted dehydrogenase/type 1 glutamine amidotransferase
MKKVLLMLNGPFPPYDDFGKMFKPLAEESGQFSVEISYDRNRFCDLTGFDSVALYIVGGEFTPEQEQGLMNFVRGGGGLLVVHGSNAGLGKYKNYLEMVGTDFIGHDPLAPFDVEVAPDVDDILPRLNRGFRVIDECYNLKICTDAPLRPFLYGTWRLDRKMLGYVRDYGEGKVCYNALGHDYRTFSSPDFRDQLFKGLRYVNGLKDNPPIRIGLVGYGPLFTMGKHHAGMIAQTHGFELVAVCDKDPKRLEVAKQEQGDRIATFTDAAELASSGKIDLGIAIVPHVYHYEVAKTLLSAGLHVITEKPFVVHVSEADELIALAREKGVMLSTYHNRHWDPDILTIRDIVESGVIGDVYSIECNMVGYGLPGQQWRSHKPISGGMLYDMGAHQFEKILQLVPWTDRRGARINRKATLYGNFVKKVWYSTSNEDYCRAYVRFENGVEAQLIQSDLCAAKKPLWTVLGTSGAIVVENWESGATVTTVDNNGRQITSQYPAIRGVGWQGYYKNVADHLLSGTPLIITAEWAKGTIQCIEGCEIASREDRLVKIEFGF